jgi:hypothetical protein
VRNHVYLLFLPLRQSRRILPAQTIRQIIRSDPKTAPDGCEVFLPKPAPLPWRVFHFHSETHSDHSSPVSRPQPMLSSVPPQTDELFRSHCLEADSALSTYKNLPDWQCTIFFASMRTILIWITDVENITAGVADRICPH